MSRGTSARDTVEKAWSRVLQLDGLDESLGFFGHGGSSLAALQAADEISVGLHLTEEETDAIIAVLVEDASLGEVVAFLETHRVKF